MIASLKSLALASTVFMSICASAAFAQSLDAIKEGTEAFKRSAYDSAIDSFSIALADPGLQERYRSVSLTLRGIAYSNLGQFEDAIRDYDSVIALTPDSALAYTRRGVARVNLEEYEKALADFDKAIELKPDNLLAQDNRSLVLDLLETSQADQVAEQDDSSDIDVEALPQQIAEEPPIDVEDETLSDVTSSPIIEETDEAAQDVAAEAEAVPDIEAEAPEPASEPASQAVEGEPYVALSSVNVRSGPSNDDDVVNTLVGGQNILKIGQSGNWVEIRPNRGPSGFVYQRFVGPREPLEDASPADIIE